MPFYAKFYRSINSSQTMENSAEMRDKYASFFFDVLHFSTSQMFTSPNMYNYYETTNKILLLSIESFASY